jgi:hypothetical protein
MRAPRLLVGFAGDRNHRTHARLAAQPRQQRPQKHLHVDHIRFRPPRSAIHRQARRLHHMNLNAASLQKARQ